MKRTNQFLTGVSLLLILSTSIAVAQEMGIHFENGLSWQQILNKAKSEHKYIFVDCYATWCGPCKDMEKEVYPLKEVGDAIDPDFISVELQMDQTKGDNDTVKSWYPVAQAFAKDYNLPGYPTYLFFDENGQAVHIATGSMKPKNFIQVTADAKDPNKQYFSLLRNYQKKDNNYLMYPVLADETYSLGYNKLAFEVAGAYIHGYLEELSNHELMNETNWTFIQKYGGGTLKIQDRLFKILLNNGTLIDTILHTKGQAYKIATLVIKYGYIMPKLDKAKQSGNEPDWKAAEKQIIKAYGENYVTGNDNLLDAKIDWYHFKKNGREYGHSLYLKCQKHYLQDGGVPANNVGAEVGLYNNDAFEIFKYDDDKADLQCALQWVTEVNKNMGSYADAMDTEANLLYKLGKKDAAIALEAKACQADRSEKEIAENYRKMLAGQPTWPDKMQ
jgi:thioredoxin-related protein